MVRLISKTKKMFGFDLRSLAVFRIALAVCIIGDFWSRSSDLAAHYTDAGVLPRAALLQFFSGEWALSLNFISGRWEIQAILFGVAIIFGFMMLVGYRTRLATFMCWLFILSIQNRNPMVDQAGDALFRMVIFWSNFLPLGACFSFDRMFAKNHTLNSQHNVISIGTVAYIFQIALLYWVTATIKLSGFSKVVWWDQGMAVYNALSFDQYTRPLGLFLLGFPDLLKILNYATILFEITGPFLFFAPIFTGFFRLMGVVFFIFMHISFAACLYIGIFTWIGCVSVLPMIPSFFWEKLDACFSGKGNGTTGNSSMFRDKLLTHAASFGQWLFVYKKHHPPAPENEAVFGLCFRQIS